MRALFNNIFLCHNQDSDAEGSYRIREYSGEPDTFADGEPFLGLVHPEAYISMIKEACMNSEYFAEVFLTPESWEAACQSVGLTIMASAQGDFAVVRPPGHHAGRASAAGFCLFNNLAIATQRLVNEGKKVFILDFDGHHGNGTQSIFYESNKVLFCSIHQMHVYPFSGLPIEVGKGEGVGYTLNYPVLSGADDKELLKRVDKAIQKAIEFKPDIVGVSAGFDGYINDSLLNLQYTKQGFYDCGYKLRRAFKNVFAVLEGGYHDELKPCIECFIDGVNRGGMPPKVPYNQDMSIG